jgi:hypothetical protein
LLETPKALSTIMKSKNFKGYHNGWSAGNQSNLLWIQVGSSETRCENHYKGKI